MNVQFHHIYTGWWKLGYRSMSGKGHRTPSGYKVRKELWLRLGEIAIRITGV